VFRFILSIIVPFIIVTTHVDDKTTHPLGIGIRAKKNGVRGHLPPNSARKAYSSLAACE
jgi:hypothetical protein